MAGTFGYELDPGTLLEVEKEQIREQVHRYREYAKLIHNGLYYRLTDPGKDAAGAWEFLSEDGSEVLVSAVMQEIHGNMPVTYICLKGLKPGCMYEETSSGKTYASDALMETGIPLPDQSGEYRGYQMHFKIAKQQEGE